MNQPQKRLQSTGPIPVQPVPTPMPDPIAVITSIVATKQSDTAVSVSFTPIPEAILYTVDQGTTPAETCVTSPCLLINLPAGTFSFTVNAFGPSGKHIGQGVSDPFALRF